MAKTNKPADNPRRMNSFCHSRGERYHTIGRLLRVTMKD
jgi:hypothetical protein